MNGALLIRPTGLGSPKADAISLMVIVVGIKGDSLQKESPQGTGSEHITTTRMENKSPLMNQLTQ